MADLPVTPVQNFGALLSQYGANQGAQQADMASAMSAPEQNAVRIAQLPLMAAQTQGAQLENAMRARQLSMLPQILQSLQSGGGNTQPQMDPSQFLSDGPPPTGGGTQGPAAQSASDAPAVGVAASGTPDSPLSAAHQQAVNALIQSKLSQPTAVPYSQRETALLNYAAVTGNSGLADTVRQQHDATLAASNAQRKQTADQAFQRAASVADAPDGQALATLQRYEPDKADQIAQFAKANNWDAAQTDTNVRNWADHVAKNTWQYSGRVAENDETGQVFDKNTGYNVSRPSTPYQASPNSAVRANVSASGDLTQIVQVPQSDGTTVNMPRWQAAGFPSLQAAQAAFTGGSGQGGAASSPLLSAGQASSGATTGRAKAAAPATTNATPAATAPPSDPVLRQALADPSYKLQAPAVRTGVSATPAQLDQQKATVAARTDLLNQANTETQGASQSLQYLKAAQQIMAAGGKPVTGIYAPIANEISRVFNGVNATNYQEVAKYLGNAALQNARQSYGSRMTQTEVQLQMNELSPSAHMTSDAIDNLLGEMSRIAQYSVASGQRVNKYLAAGGDPQKFDIWNQQYFPREQVVNTGAAGSSGANPSAATPNSATLSAVAAPAAAVAYLAAHPEVAPQFKAKYGYLPSGSPAPAAAGATGR